MSNALAINGAAPVRTKPWHESNALGKEEQDAVMRVMKNGHLSLFQGAHKPHPPYSFLGGPEVQALEKLAGEMFGAKHVVSINSATSGLSAAIGTLGLGLGDEVIVSPYTMSACAVAPLWYGAIPVFADTDSETGSLDPASVRDCITPRTKAILVVHQFGIPAEMDGIMSIAKEHKLKVIEDCAQAWNAKYRGKTVGTIGDIGIFSFNVHKTIQSGEGGLCVTNNTDLALRLQMIRNHGESVVGDASVKDITNLVGGNFRLTELQAAICQEQLKKLEGLNAKRIAMVEKLYDGIADIPFLAVPRFAERTATYYVCPMRYLEEKTKGVPRAEFVKMLAAEGVPFGEAYVQPLYMLPIFQTKTAFAKGYPWSAKENAGSNPSYAAGTCPNAEVLHEKEMMLNFYMCHPQELSDVDDVITAIHKVAPSILH